MMNQYDFNSLKIKLKHYNFSFNQKTELVGIIGKRVCEELTDEDIKELSKK